MYKIGDLIELKIEKMVYEGYGLAHINSLDDNNFVFFVENACDGDVVTAQITKLKKNYGYAVVKEIIEPSKFRVKPFCPLHNACGGCQWQHINYEHQLEIKNEIVKDILSKELKKEVTVESTLPSPNINIYRYKIQMPVSQTKNSKRFLIGYYKKKSHEIVNIKHCPVQPDIINKIIEKIRELAKDFKVEAYSEKSHKGELRHIIFRVSRSFNEILICFVVNNDVISKPLNNLAHYLFDGFEQIKGISINFNTKKTNVILGNITQNMLGSDIYKEKLGDITYLISPDSFFQVNPESFRNILDTVKKEISKRIKNSYILDAYSGVGSFGLYLSDIASKITCVEEVKNACDNAKNACELNNIKNIEIINGDAQDIFKELINKNKKYDVIILDPPRKGCSKESLDFCNKLTDKIIVYVSCNPNSLARDLTILKEYGFELTFAQTVDMFCNTYHVETIAVVEKKHNLG